MEYIDFLRIKRRETALKRIDAVVNGEVCGDYIKIYDCEEIENTPEAQVEKIKEIIALYGV